ncbi:Kinesin-like protein kif2a [Dinochytrium kinnereticum]|nr:Kinesin-like protein kif2a [Dinochytrium kinnereticum]
MQTRSRLSDDLQEAAAARLSTARDGSSISTPGRSSHHRSKEGFDSLTPFTSSKGHGTVTSNSDSPSSYQHTTTSKAVLKVLELKAARESRRAEAAARRKTFESLDDIERENMPYLADIDSFRSLYASQLAHQVYDSSDFTGCLNEGNRNNFIKVSVRKRPLNAAETEKKLFDIVTTRTAVFPNARLFLHEPKLRVDRSKCIETHEFLLDQVFDEDASNLDVYKMSVKPLVKEFFNEGMCTFFAYGQTGTYLAGSGKTHTVFGNPREPGIYEHACRDVFKTAESLDPRRATLSFRISFYEIYGGKVRDLLSSNSKIRLMEDREGAIKVLGLREVSVTDVGELLKLVREGQARRTTGQTEANSESSRSHAVFQILLSKTRPGSAQIAPDTPSAPTVRGKLILIDLAGSERAVDAGKVDKLSRQEGSEINKSLLALKECIRALYRRNSGKPTPSKPGALNPAASSAEYIPFRGSKLTQILRDSFIGRNSHTVMVATISPGSNSAEHTLNTLRYADRVKELRSQKKVKLSIQTRLSGSCVPPSDDYKMWDARNEMASRKKKGHARAKSIESTEDYDDDFDDPTEDHCFELKSYGTMKNDSDEASSSEDSLRRSLSPGPDSATRKNVQPSHQSFIRDEFHNARPQREIAQIPTGQFNQTKSRETSPFESNRGRIQKLVDSHRDMIKAEESILRTEKQILLEVTTGTKFSTNDYVDQMGEHLKKRADLIISLWEKIREAVECSDQDIRDS